MIYSVQILLTFVLVIFSVSDAFRMVSPAQSSAALKMSLADYKEELGKTAALIAGPGKKEFKNCPYKLFLFFSFL